MVLLAAVTSCTVQAPPANAGTTMENPTPQVNAAATMEKPMKEPNNSTHLSLTGSASVKDGKLIVNYELKSNLPYSVYVFDEMIAYNEEGRPKIDRSTAYRFWEEPNTLRLVRAVLKMPREKDVYSLEIPYARELKPQAELTGNIELDVPVKEKSPFYGFPKPDTSKEVECDRIKLYIGWTEATDGIKIQEATIGGEKVLRIRGKWQPRLVSADFNVAVKVVAHTDTFDRQMPQQ
ncbi:MAG: hypothetical protein AB7F88_08210 [Pyrinomonadaceae bacterium]